MQADLAQLSIPYLLSDGSDGSSNNVGGQRGPVDPSCITCHTGSVCLPGDVLLSATWTEKCCKFPALAGGGRVFFCDRSGQ